MYDIFTGTELIDVMPEQQLTVPSFDMAGGNADMIHAVCEEISTSGICAFLSSTPGSIHSYHGMNHYVREIREIAQQYEAKVAIHLDHATQLVDIREALSAGFSSVMIDASQLPLEDNIALTKEVVDIAHELGVTVEAELGTIGGKEDEIMADNGTFPTADECKYFIESTGADLFAPGIGTIHGIYKHAPALQWNLIETLGDQVKKPMVLHGCSGLSTSIFRNIIKHGYKKANFATDIREAFRTGIRNSIARSNGIQKPQEFLASGRESVRGFIRQTYDMILV